MKIAIVGAGKFGTKAAEILLGGGHSVTVIDKDEAPLNKIISVMDVMTVNGNGKELTVLKSVGIESYDFLIAATDRDEKNLTIAAFAKKLGCRKVIARVRDPEHMYQLDFIKETMNIDYLVNPDFSITIEIYRYLIEKYQFSHGIFTSGRASLVQFKASMYPALVNMPLTYFNKILPGMLAVAISRNGKVIIPHGDAVIENDDTLYVIGEESKIKAFNEKVHIKGKYTSLRKVMIVGGGKTGFYLARKLKDFGISVKIVEENKERCRYLASHLEDVMILHGDATDISFLIDENLEEMDAFITTTGFDEENLLLALMAKQHGVPDVIAKVSRESYFNLTERLGIDMALNPLDIEASHMLRYIQGSRRVISSQLIQGQAEILEIVASDKLTLMNKPLKELSLPAGVIIAAIHRGTNVIIPNGDTVIRDDDRVIIVSLLSEIPEVEKLLTSKKLSFL